MASVNVLMEGYKAGVLKENEQTLFAGMLGKLRRNVDMDIPLSEMESTILNQASEMGLVQFPRTRGQGQEQSPLEQETSTQSSQPGMGIAANLFSESIPQIIKDEALPVAGSLGMEALSNAYPPLRGAGLVSKLLRLGQKSLASGLGAAGGETLEQLMKKEELQAVEIGKEFGFGAASIPAAEAAKRIASPVRSIIRHAKNTTIKEAKAINNLLKPFNLKLLNSQATTSGILDLFQNLWEESLTTSGKAREVLRSQSQAFNDMLNMTAIELTKGADALKTGDMFLSVVANNKEFSRQAASNIYKSIDVLTNNAKIVNLGPVFKMVDDLPRIKRKFYAAVRDANVEIIEELIPNTITINNAVYAAPGTKKSGKAFAGFAEIKEVSSDFKAIIRKFKETHTLGTKESRAIRLIEKQIARQMKIAAKNAKDPNTLKTLKEADAAWREYSQTFGTKFIKKLILSDDGLEIGQKLRALKTPKQARMVKKAINNPELWKQIRGNYLASLFNDSTLVTAGLSDVGGGEIIGKKLQTVLKKTPKPILEEMLGKDTLKRVNRYAQGLFLVQEKQGKGTGRVAGALLQAAAAGGVVHGVATKAGKPILSGLSILLSPLLFGKVLQSDDGLKILLEGLEGYSTHAKAAAAFARITTLLAGDEFVESEKRAKKRAKILNPRAFMAPRGVLSPTKTSSSSGVLNNIRSRN